jgi:hypothetical protein
MDQDKMSKHYRGPSINASYQVSIHLVEGFQRRRLKCEKLTDGIPSLIRPLHHWGKADDRNCNYGHPKMAVEIR